MKTWRPVWIVVAIAAVLRFLQLGAENYWVDEVLQIGYSRGLAIGVVRSTSQALLHFVLQVAENEFATRLQSAVFSIAEVLLVYHFAKRYFGGRTATLAALFLAISPLHIWYAQEVRWYSQWSLVATGTFYLLARLLEAPIRRTWLAYGALTVLNLYTFVLTVPLMAVQGLIGLVAPRKDRIAFLARLAGVQAAALILASPVVWWMLSGVGPTGTPRATRPVALAYTFFAYFAGYSAGPNLTELHALPGVEWILATYPEVAVYFAVFGWLAVVGLRAALRSDWPGREVVLPWALGMPLAIFVIALVVGGTYNVRYTLVSLPGAYLVLALGVAEIRRVPLRRLAIGAAVLCFAFSLGNYYLDPHYDKEDARGALRHVVESGDAGAPVLVAGQIETVVRYYAPEVGAGRIVSCREGALAALEFRADRHATLWALAGRDWDDELEPCLARLAPGHVPIEAVGEYTGVRLIRLGSPDGP